MEDLGRRNRGLGVETTGAAFALQPISDVELIKAYALCFDRPAFQDHFRQEGSMEAFDKAIEDTIVGINTGSIRTRDGTTVMQTRGKVFLKDQRLRERMDVIVDLLRWIRFRYADGVKRKAITFHGASGGESFYCIHEHELAHWMDSARTQVLQLFSEACHTVGIQPPSLRRGHRQELTSMPPPPQRVQILFQAISPLRFITNGYHASFMNSGRLLWRLVMRDICSEPLTTRIKRTNWRAT